MNFVLSLYCYIHILIEKLDVGVAALQRVVTHSTSTTRHVLLGTEKNWTLVRAPLVCQIFVCANVAPRQL